MLAVYNKDGFEEVILCERENILSVESTHSILDKIYEIRNNQHPIYVAPDYTIFTINFVYGISPKSVSFPKEIISAIWDATDNGKAKNEKLAQYLDVLKNAYMKSVVMYRNTGANQRYFTVNEITQVLRDINALKIG